MTGKWNESVAFRWNAKNGRGSGEGDIEGTDKRNERERKRERGSERYFEWKWGCIFRRYIFQRSVDYISGAIWV